MATPPFKVKAVYDYNSPHEDDLSFSNGQIVTVTEVEDDDWYVGEYIDASGSKKDGLFPKNFVETYEPEPPPRPTRGARARNNDLAGNTKGKAGDDDVGEESGMVVQQEHKSQVEPKPSEAIPTQIIQTASINPEQPQFQEEEPSTTVKTPPPAPKPAPAVPATTKGLPPVIVEKPSSFRDKIAAFNKPAAPPIAPFKPNNIPSGFIKKPFVAPPPSRNAYVPPQRENPRPKPVLREDNLEFSQTRSDEQAGTVDSGPTGLSSTTDHEEEAPKSTSLKERIALLQKQQLEQAARRADQAQKEKPKKPSKKLTDSSEKSGGQDEDTPEPDRHPNVEESGKFTSQQVVKSPSTEEDVYDGSSEIRGTGLRDRDIHSDGYKADQSAAGETIDDATGNSTTSVEEDDGRANAAQSTKENANLSANHAESSEEEEDDMDPETRRRMELRERMAKMSGGMGMPGMFNPFGGAAMGGTPSKKRLGEKSTDQQESQASKLTQESQRVPIIPVPGVSRKHSTPTEPPSSNTGHDDERIVKADSDHKTYDTYKPDLDQDKLQKPDEKIEESQARTSSQPATPRGPPAVPIMPHSSAEEVQPVPNVPEVFHSPIAGSESDDEISIHAMSTSRHDRAAMSRDSRLVEQSPPVAENAQSPISSDISSIPDPSRSQGLHQKRPSRPPPIPRSSSTADTTASTSNRRPPPPPPPSSQDGTFSNISPTSRQSTFDAMAGGMMTRKSLESETVRQDFDRRPRSSQRDALGSYSNISGSATAENMIAPPLDAYDTQEKMPMGHRAAPPPIPGQGGRKSVEISRAPLSLPPPIPSAAAPSLPYSANRQNPANQNVPMQDTIVPNVRTPRQEFDDDDLYNSSPIRKSSDKSAFSHARSSIPPPSSHIAFGQVSPRSSHEYTQASGGFGRKSMDHSRTMNEREYIASDVDLGTSSKWWTQPNSLPPVFRDRNDILYEVEESSDAAKKAATKSKHLYILYRDYSQTIIDVEFDARNMHDVRLEQRHDPPPPRLRQDQLEEAHGKLGLRLSEAVVAKQNTVVGDGSPQALIMDLLRAMPSALWPVGTRAYGALVYANIANATVQQYDEIRAGDIVTLRNAKLQGKHGPMHQKYAIEVGKPDHVGVVVDWDGTKKKVRAWEQGRESKKVKIESYKIGDLKSGEVRVWRVMDRSWVGWGSDQ